MSPHELAAHLGIARSAAGRLVDAAQVYATFDSASSELRELGVEAVDHLLGVGLASIDRLRAMDLSGREQLATTLAENASPFVSASAAELRARYLGLIATL